MPDFVALFLLGLVSGATVCSLGCLPQLGPYLLGSADGFREGFYSTLSFLVGKLWVYAMWGGLAGGVGAALLGQELHGERWAGLFLVVAGILLPVFNRRKCPQKLGAIGNRGTLFTLGAATSLLPCPSLLGLLAVAAGSGSVVLGATSGASFGVGIVCSPLLIAGGGLGMLAGRLRLEVGGMQRIFQGFAMLMLISMGVRLLLEVS
ncbi:MAG: sulfite exporter TauE/SafE family protein [Proteobacteria bacterium]|nr:sulfite exporter TauE/SafE family protein [Pseudomonadota bacterium]